MVFWGPKTLPAQEPAVTTVTGGVVVVVAPMPKEKGTWLAVFPRFQIPPAALEVKVTPRRSPVAKGVDVVGNIKGLAKVAASGVVAVAMVDGGMVLPEPGARTCGCNVVGEGVRENGGEPGAEGG